MIFQEEDHAHIRTSKRENMRDSNKRKTDQVKIPVFTGLHNSTMISRGMERTYSTLTKDHDDDEARAGQLPDFGGN